MAAGGKIIEGDVGAGGELGGVAAPVGGGIDVPGVAEVADPSQAGVALQHFEGQLADGDGAAAGGGIDGGARLEHEIVEVGLPVDGEGGVVGERARCR